MQEAEEEESLRYSRRVVAYICPHCGCDMYSKYPHLNCPAWQPRTYLNEHRKEYYERFRETENGYDCKCRFEKKNKARAKRQAAADARLRRKQLRDERKAKE